MTCSAEPPQTASSKFLKFKKKEIIQFSSNCGTNLKISSNQFVAKRLHGACGNSICFLNKSFKCKDKVKIKIRKIIPSSIPFNKEKTVFPGSIQFFGFTDKPPSSIDQETLPKKINSYPIKACTHFAFFEVPRNINNKNGYIIKYWFEDGKFYYIIKEEGKYYSPKRALIYGNVSTRKDLWALFDLSGNIDEIESLPANFSGIFIYCKPAMYRRKNVSRFGQIIGQKFSAKSFAVFNKNH